VPFTWVTVWCSGVSPRADWFDRNAFGRPCISASCFTSVSVTRNWDSRGQLKCHGTRAETRFRLSAKRTGPFKSAGASVQSSTGSRGVRISGSNAGYTTFRGSVKSTGYPLHSPVPLPCVTVCHHISTGLYLVTDHECLLFCGLLCGAVAG
jgi:hypothetical protein